MRRATHWIVLGLVATLAVATLAGTASAKPGKAKGKGKARPAVTKISFKLVDHDLAVGESATANARVLTRSGKSWVPLEGAVLAVSLDHAPAGEVATDGDGRAIVEVPAGEPGEHVVKVRYAGDSTHKKAQRAQGFEVTGTWFIDSDGDGYGDPSQPVQGLTQPEGAVADATDCDDTNAAVNPAASEDALNGVDDNCDGQVDEVA